MTWLKATNLSTAGAPTSYSGTTPVLDWVTSYSNTAAANIVYTSNKAFDIAASHDSTYLTSLFTNNVGLTYKVKMISYDPNSKSAKN